MGLRARRGRGRLQKTAWIAALPAGPTLGPPPRGSAPGLRRSLPGPGAGVSVPSFRAARVDPGGSAEKLPPFRGASERRGPAALGPRWGRAGSRGPSQAARSPGLSAGGQSQQHDDRTSTGPRMRSRGLAPTTPAVSSGPGLWAAAPRGPGISLHLAGRRFTTKSPRKLPSQ